MLIYTTLNPLSAKKSKVQIQSESDFMLARLAFWLRRPLSLLNFMQERVFMS